MMLGEEEDDDDQYRSLMVGEMCMALWLSYKLVLHVLYGHRC